MDTFTPNFGRMERNEVLGLQFRMEEILFVISLDFSWASSSFLMLEGFFLSDKG